MIDQELWEEVIQKQRNLLVNRVDAHQCATHLRTFLTITSSEFERVRCKNKDEALVELLDILPRKNCFWETLLGYLEIANQSSVRNTLIETYEKIKVEHGNQQRIDNMNNPKIWNSVMSEYRSILSNYLDGHQCATQLCLYGLITPVEKSTITGDAANESRNHITSADALLKLLDILVTKDSYWKGLLKYLKNANQSHVVEKLVEAYHRIDRLYMEIGAPNVVVPLSPELQLLQDEIQQFIRSECQPIEQVWRDLLPNVDLSSAYVGLVILPVSGNKDNSVPIPDDGYSYIWKEPGSRIVIEGDPGVGKSTYLCNLAVNWVISFDGENQEVSKKYDSLREHFDFVIYIPLGRLCAESILKVVKAMCDERISDYDIKSLLTSKERRTRVLLLLDGFEELDTEKFKEIDEIINMKKYFEVKTIISTRPSHTLAIRKRHLTLKINGFSEGQAKEFIQKQGMDWATVNCDLQLQILQNQKLYNPLQLSILCVVATDQKKRKQLDSADGYALQIEWLIKYLIDRKSCEKADGSLLQDDENEKIFWELLLQLGPLAVSKTVTNERQKNLFNTFNVSEFPQKSNDGTIMVALETGIVVKKRLLTSTGLKFKYDYTFLHHLIAEFIAAYYLTQFVDISEEFCKKLCDTYFKLEDCVGKIWQQSALFYFMTKFSEKFAATAFQEMLSPTKHNKMINTFRTVPWFATLPTSLKCYTSKVSYFEFYNVKEYPAVEILKVIAQHQDIKTLIIQHCEIQKCLPTLLNIVENLTIVNCNLGYSGSVWNSELPVKAEKVHIAMTSIHPELADVLCRLSACANLSIALDEQTLGSLRAVSSIPNLKLSLWNVSFTNNKVNDWCKAAKLVHLLDRLVFSLCNLQDIDSDHFLEIGTTFEVSYLEFKKCHMSTEIRSLFTKDSRLSLSLKRLAICLFPSVEMIEPILQNLKHLIRLKQLTIDTDYLEFSGDQIAKLCTYIGEMRSFDYDYVKIDVEITGDYSINVDNLMQVLSNPCIGTVVHLARYHSFSSQDITKITTAGWIYAPLWDGNGYTMTRFSRCPQLQETDLKLLAEKLSSVHVEDKLKPLNCEHHCFSWNMEHADRYALLIEYYLKHMFKISNRAGLHTRMEVDEASFWQWLQALGPLAISEVLRDGRQNQLLMKFLRKQEGGEEQINDALEAGILRRSQERSFEFNQFEVAEFIAAYHLAQFEEFDREFCKKLCASFYKLNENNDDGIKFIWKKSPLFYFLTKFSKEFVATAFVETVISGKKLSELRGTSGTIFWGFNSIPWFANLPTSLESVDWEISDFQFEEVEEYSALQVLQVVATRRDILKVNFSQCAFYRCLPTLLTIVDDLKFSDCVLDCPVWNTKLPTKTAKLSIEGKSYIPEFNDVLSRLNSCIELKFASSQLRTLTCFCGIGSMKNLRRLELWNVDFTNDQIKDWCEAAKPVQLLEVLSFIDCNFSHIDSERLLEMGTTFEVSDLEFKKCQMSTEISALFAEDSKLSRSLKRLTIYHSSKVGTLNCFCGIGSIKCLKYLDLRNVDFTNDQIQEWCEAAKPGQSLEKLIFSECNFSNVDSQCLLEMSSTLEVGDLVIRKCTVSNAIWSASAEFSLYLKNRFLKTGPLLADKAILSLHLTNTVLYVDVSRLTADVAAARWKNKSEVRKLKSAFNEISRTTINENVNCSRDEKLNLWKAKLTDWRGRLTKAEKKILNEIIKRHSLTGDQLRSAFYAFVTNSSACQDMLNYEQFKRLCTCIGELRSLGDHHVELEVAGDFTVNLDNLKPIFNNQSIGTFIIRQAFLPLSDLEIEDFCPDGWTYLLSESLDGTKQACWSRQCQMQKTGSARDKSKMKDLMELMAQEAFSTAIGIVFSMR